MTNSNIYFKLSRPRSFKFFKEMGTPVAKYMTFHPVKIVFTSMVINFMIITAHSRKYCFPV